MTFPCPGLRPGRRIAEPAAHYRADPDGSKCEGGFGRNVRIPLPVLWMRYSWMRYSWMAQLLALRRRRTVRYVKPAIPDPKSMSTLGSGTEVPPSAA